MKIPSLTLRLDILTMVKNDEAPEVGDERAVVELKDGEVFARARRHTKVPDSLRIFVNILIIVHLHHTHYHHHHHHDRLSLIIGNPTSSVTSSQCERERDSRHGQ